MKSLRNNYRLLLSAVILFGYAVLASGSWSTGKILRYVLIVAGIVFVGSLIFNTIMTLLANSIDKQIALYEKEHPLNDDIVVLKGNLLGLYVNKRTNSVSVCAFGPKKYTEKVFDNFVVFKHYFSPSGDVYIIDRDNKKILYAMGTMLGGFSYCDYLSIPLMSDTLSPSDIECLGIGRCVYLINPLRSQMAIIKGTEHKSVLIPGSPNDIMELKKNIEKDEDSPVYYALFFFDSSRTLILSGCDDNYKILKTFEYDKLGIRLRGINHFDSDTSYDVSHHLEKDKVSEFIFNEPNYRKVTTIEKKTTALYRGSEVVLELMYNGESFATYQLCEYYDEKKISDFSYKKITNAVTIAFNNIVPLYERVKLIKDDSDQTPQWLLGTKGFLISNMPLSKNDIDQLIVSA